VRASAPVFLRRHHRDKDGKRHTNWSLGETVRRPDGPRQRTRCHLGELNDSAQARGLKTIEVFHDAEEGHQRKLFPSDVTPPPDEAEVAQVLIQQVRLGRTRPLGRSLLGLARWRQRRPDEVFEGRLDTAPADVPWPRVAAVRAIHRLCAPGSERAVEARWDPTTALDDRLHMPDGKINDSRLDRALDPLLSTPPVHACCLPGRYQDNFKPSCMSRIP
jgi:hypothetical protein